MSCVDSPCCLLEYLLERSPYGRSDPDQRAWRSFRPGITEMDPSAPGGPNNGCAQTKGKALSNAMRKGKRSLAGVAAGALGLSLIPFVGVGTASADLAISASQNVIRAAKTAGLGASTINVTANADTTIAVDGASTGGAVGILVNSAPAGATPAAGTAQAANLSSANLVKDTPKATVVLGTVFSLPGTYTATVWLNTNASGSATTIDAGEPTTSLTINVGGAPSSIQLTPSSLTLGAGGAAGAFTIGLKDSSGVSTAVSGVETVSVTANAATGTAPAIGTASFATGAGTAGASTYANTLDPAAATAGTYTYAVSAFGVASPATLSASVVAASTAATKLALTSASNTATLAAASFDYTNGTAVAAASASATISYSQVNPTRKTFTVEATGEANKAVSVYVASGKVATGLPGTTTENGVPVTDAIPASAQQATAVANASGIATFEIAVGTATAGTQILVLAAKPATNAANGSPSLGLKYATAVPAASESGEPTVADVGAAVPIVVTVEDQYENPVSGYLVTAQTIVTTAGTGGPTVGTLGVLASGTTGADGTATLSVSAPAGTVNGTVANVRYSVTTNTGAALATPVSNVVAFAVSYTTGGAIATLVTSLPTTEATATTIALPSGVAAPTGGSLTTFTVTATPATPVTLSAPTGVYMNTAAPEAWNDGASSITAVNTDTVRLWATKPGTYAITASAGGKTATGYVKVTDAVAASARNIEVTPATGETPPGSVTGLKVKVTDVFGNPVAAAAGSLTATVSGPGFINGSLLTLTLPATDAAGETAFTVSVPSTATEGKVTVDVVANGVSGGAWVAQYGAANGYINGSATSTPAGAPVGGAVVGFPASVSTAQAEFDVSTPAPVKSLSITAYRSGGNVIVDGDAPGFSRGDKVDIRVAKYNNKKKKWNKAKTLATVQVKKDESFSAIVSISGKVRVTAISGDVKSNRVQVAK